MNSSLGMYVTHTLTWFVGSSVNSCAGFSQLNEWWSAWKPRVSRLWATLQTRRLCRAMPPLFQADPQLWEHERTCALPGGFPFWGFFLQRPQREGDLKRCEALKMACRWFHGLRGDGSESSEEDLNSFCTSSRFLRMSQSIIGMQIHHISQHLGKDSKRQKNM